mmetsp:Transcript_8636/g.13578  ORF Transcript_8636/g.13578 Transcript_8636/m.13578 type:complete len:118 (+) Transcript_8636:981-1334(+)
MQWSLPEELVAGLKVSSRLQQQLDHLLIAPLCSQVQGRGRLLVVECMNISTCHYQTLGDCLMPMLCCQVQRCEEFIVTGLQVSTCTKQTQNNCDMPILSCQVQRGFIVVGVGLQVGP